MSLVDNEVIGEYEEVSSGQVHFKQTRCLVPTVTNEALVTPVMDSSPILAMLVRGKKHEHTLTMVQRRSGRLHMARKPPGIR